MRYMVVFLEKMDLSLKPHKICQIFRPEQQERQKLFLPSHQQYKSYDIDSLLSDVGTSCKESYPQQSEYINSNNKNSNTNGNRVSTSLSHSTKVMSTHHRNHNNNNNNNNNGNCDEIGGGKGEDGCGSGDGRTGILISGNGRNDEESSFISGSNNARVVRGDDESSECPIRAGGRGSSLAASDSDMGTDNNTDSGKYINYLSSLTYFYFYF